MFLVLLLSAAFVYWRVTFALDRQLDQDLEAWRNVVIPAAREGRQPPADTPGQTYQVFDTEGHLLSGDQRVQLLATPERVRAVTASTPLEYDLGGFLPPADRAYRVRLVRIPTTDGER